MSYVTSLLSLFFVFFHENPLNKNALNKSGEFLYHASFFAEKSLNHGSDHGGLDYANCVELKENYAASYCENLYKKIYIFSRTKQNKAYADLMIDDLLEANSYFQVRSNYYNQVYLHSKKFDIKK